MGTKLQKTVDYGSYQVMTDYRDGYQYETMPQTNGGRGYAELLFFPTAEGYVKALYKDDPSDHAPAAYQYVYIYKDHLGNNRLSYTFDPETNQIKILEENHYYPFGLKHGSYNAIRKDVKYEEQLPTKRHVEQTTADAVKFKYLYNGKELQDELGLNIYDYGARTYDPAAPRFWQVDPLAEKYSFQSVYVYADDNPVRFIDIDGKGTEDEWVIFSTGETVRVGDKGGDKTDYITKVNKDGSITNIEQAAGKMKETGFFNQEKQKNSNTGYSKGTSTTNIKVSTGISEVKKEFSSKIGDKLSLKMTTSIDVETKINKSIFFESYLETGFDMKNKLSIGGGIENSYYSIGGGITEDGIYIKSSILGTYHSNSISLSEGLSTTFGYSKNHIITSYTISVRPGGLMLAAVVIPITISQPELGPIILTK